MSTVGLPTPVVRPAHASHRSPLRPDVPFPAGAAAALAERGETTVVQDAVRGASSRRAKALREVRDLQHLRTAAEAIRRSTMDQLPELLLELEEKVTAAGGRVHWARDADEAADLVAGLAVDAGAEEVVTTSSSTLREIRLAETLDRSGIRTVPTDLGSQVLALTGEQQTHPVAPAVHRDATAVRDALRAGLPGAPPDLSDDPEDLVAASRAATRDSLVHASFAVTGANAAIAETGTLALVESAGNGRFAATVPEHLVTVMGVEKVLPSFRDLEVLLQLLTRSATGERMSPYTSLLTGPGADGPRSLDLVLLDNGRSATLADEVGRAALHCIGCGACSNVCPVYERTGGAAYGSVRSGPIGAILSPQMTGMHGEQDPASSLPYASSLCGACDDVCPVKIPINEILVHLRTVDADSRTSDGPDFWKVAMQGASRLMRSPTAFETATRLTGLGRHLGDRNTGRLPWPAAMWTDARDLVVPQQSFRAWWRTEHGDGPAPAREEREEER